MQRIAPSLFIASRVLALCAVLAGLFGGLLMATIGAGLICFNTCPSPEFYFSQLGLYALFFLIPCSVLAALALVLFLIYCLSTRQPRRALSVFLFFLVGGLLGVVILDALLQLSLATFPVQGEHGLLIGGSGKPWASQWALAVLLIAVVWSVGMASLQWGRRWRPLRQLVTP
jgi:hypothetical protein